MLMPYDAPRLRQLCIAACGSTPRLSYDEGIFNIVSLFLCLSSRHLFLSQSSAYEVVRPFCIVMPQLPVVSDETSARWEEEGSFDGVVRWRAYCGCRVALPQPLNAGIFLLRSQSLSSCYSNSYHIFAGSPRIRVSCKPWPSTVVVFCHQRLDTCADRIWASSGRGWA